MAKSFLKVAVWLVSFTFRVLAVEELAKLLLAQAAAIFAARRKLKDEGNVPAEPLVQTQLPPPEAPAPVEPAVLAVPVEPLLVASVTATQAPAQAPTVVAPPEGDQDLVDCAAAVLAAEGTKQQAEKEPPRPPRSTEDLKAEVQTLLKQFLTALHKESWGKARDTMSQFFYPGYDGKRLVVVLTWMVNNDECFRKTVAAGNNLVFRLQLDKDGVSDVMDLYPEGKRGQALLYALLNKAKSDSEEKAKAARLSREASQRRKNGGAGTNSRTGKTEREREKERLRREKK